MDGADRREADDAAPAARVLRSTSEEAVIDQSSGGFSSSSSAIYLEFDVTGNGKREGTRWRLAVAATSAHLRTVRAACQDE
ncbi:hypothetical protein CRG98_050453 [Punica granatum]|uniref:Uncharacterized protein n=1 Tax=Punica granatum TaxID=22663 RepID=A0A2I0GBI1_PUNGR|nr:hypothetical protein CRG98_050453 [Punica granatum]